MKNQSTKQFQFLHTIDNFEYQILVDKLHNNHNAIGSILQKYPCKKEDAYDIEYAYHLLQT